MYHNIGKRHMNLPVILITLSMILVLGGCDYVSDVRVIHERIADFDVYEALVHSDEIYASENDIEIRGDFRKLVYAKDYGYMTYEVSEDHVNVYMDVILETKDEHQVIETVTIRYVNTEKELLIVHRARQNDTIDQEPIDIDVFLDRINGLSVTEMEWMLFELGYDAVNER